MGDGFGFRMNVGDLFLVDMVKCYFLRSSYLVVNSNDGLFLKFEIFVGYFCKFVKLNGYF